MRLQLAINLRNKRKMKSTLYWSCLLLFMFSLQGCGTVKGWFSDDEDNPREPAELAKISSNVAIKKIWSVSVGNGQGKGLYRIKPFISNDTIYVAANDGQIKAINRLSGKLIWKAEIDSNLSGGVGLYRDKLFLGTVDGRILMADTQEGEIIWSVRLTGEVLAPPQSNGEVVVVQTYDGKLSGLDFLTGEKLWTFDSNLPVLTIRGTGTPIFSGSTVYASFANGRVLAFDSLSGSILWETRVAIAKGRSDIERMVDIDGAMAIQGGQLFAASYQGRLAAIDLTDGSRLWQREISSITGTSLGFGNVYVVDDNGTVNAYLSDGQGLRWSQDALAFRDLSRPIPVSGYVAVVDFEGYLHLMSQLDGEFVGRARPDKNGARADMISMGNVLYVYGNSGKLLAYEIRSKKI